jgi:hypothetical protein
MSDLECVYVSMWKNNGGENKEETDGLYTPDLISSQVKSTEVCGVWGREAILDTPDLIGSQVK